MINFAHRGASSDYPENTLLAFEEGIKCGASGIELDVHKTKDNKIVVIHDEEVERTFKGKGLVKDFTLRELKELQTRRALFEGVQGTGIPTLEEVLDLVEKKFIPTASTPSAKVFYYKMKADYYSYLAEF